MKPPFKWDISDISETVGRPVLGLRQPKASLLWGPMLSFCNWMDRLGQVDVAEL